MNLFEGIIIGWAALAVTLSAQTEGVDPAPVAQPAVSLDIPDDGVRVAAQDRAPVGRPCGVAQTTSRPRGATRARNRPNSPVAEVINRLPTVRMKQA